MNSHLSWRVLFLLKILLVLAISSLLFADNAKIVDERDPIKSKSLEVSRNGFARVLEDLEETDFPANMRCRLDTAAVDIVFCIDSSGSMGPVIEDLRDEMSGFVSELEARRYDYRLGAVCFDDSTGVWDFDGATPGNQMTASSAAFIARLTATSESATASDLNEVSLDAIVDAINSYTWRPDAIHVIFMFTNEGYHYRGDGTAWSDVTMSETYALALGGGYIIFIAASSRPRPSTPIPAGMLDSLQMLAEDSGGEYYTFYDPPGSSLVLDFGDVLEDILALLNTYVAIGAQIANTSGVTCAFNAQLLPINPSCVTIHSTNPITGDMTPSGMTEYFSWHVIVDSLCEDEDRCFTIRVWGCGDNDTIFGCTTDDTCYGEIDYEIDHMPPVITSTCIEVSPNPFDVEVTLTNNRTRPLFSTSMWITSPVLTFEGGDDNPNNIGYVEYMGGTESMTWTLGIPESAYGTEQCYRVWMYSEETDTVFTEYCVTIPALLPNPEIDATASDSLLCPGECANLNANNTTPGSWTYHWSPADYLSSTSIQNPVSCPDHSMQYIVEVTDGSGLGCESVDTVNIVVADSLFADAGEDIEVCAAEEVEIGGDPTGSGGYGELSYSWSPVTGLDDPTSPNPTVTITGTTTYTLTITDEALCTATDEVTVTVSPPIDVDAGPDRLICEGGSVRIGGDPTGAGGIGSLAYHWTPIAGLSNPSSPNPTASPSTTTQYIVEVVDDIHCSSFDTVVVRISPPIVADAGEDAAVCAGIPAHIGGDPSGSGGTPPLEYSWSPETDLDDPTSPNPNASPTTTTTYTLTVTDSAGCTETDEVTVNISPPMTLDPGMDETICWYDTYDLGGSPTASGGTPPYIYEWTPVDEVDDASIPNPVATPTAPYSIYTLIVTDDLGCSDTVQVQITLAPEIEVNAGENDTICWDETARLGGSPTATGGHGTLSYSWTPSSGLSSSTSSNPVYTPTGPVQTYILTVTDELGCFSMDTVTIWMSPELFVDAGDDIDICFGYSEEIGGDPAAWGGTPPYEYSWFPDIGLTDATAPRTDASPPISTSYTLTVTDAAGCVNADIIDVTVAPEIVIDAGEDDTLCWGETTTLGGAPTASGGLGDLDIVWSPSTGLSSTTDPNPTCNPSVTTTYILTVTDDADCLIADTVTITRSPEITVEAGTDETICDGATVVLGGSPTATGGLEPLSYSWSPISGLDDPTLPNPEATPSVNTTYVLTVIDAAGCTETDEVTLSLTPEIVVDAGENDTICEGESVELGGSPTMSGGTGDLTVSWSPVTGLDDPTSPNPTASPTTSTEYIVTVTDEIDCPAYDTVFITVSPEMTADAGEDQTICYETRTRLGGDPSITGGLEPYEYSWTPTYALDDPTSPNPEANPLTTTTYTLTVTDAAGCVATDVVEIQVSPEIIADAGEDITECIGTTVSLGGAPSGSGGIPPLSYVWSPSSSLDDAEVPNPMASATDTTIYVLTVYDSSGCFAVDSVTVNIIDVPGAVELVSPPNGTSDIPPTTILLDWDEADGFGPFTYDLYVDDELYASSLTETEHYYPIECDELHTWYVIASNMCGDSEPSETWSFSTTYSPSPPTLIMPVDGSIADYPTTRFTWFNSVLGTEPILYDFYVDGWLVETDLTDTLYNYRVDCDREYEWYVVAHNVCGDTTSEEWTFDTPASTEAPELILPIDGSYVEPPATTLLWHSSPGDPVIYYDIYMNDTLIIADLTDTAYTIPIECDNSAEWYVVAHNVCGEYASEEWEFYTPESPSAPELISPMDSELVYLPEAHFIWHNSEEGTAPIVYDFLFNGSPVALGITDTTLDFPIDCEYEYTWQVIARNICGEAASEIWTFPSQDCGSPVARIISPFRGAWTACDDQVIKMFVYDSLGLITERLEVDITINGVGPTTYDLGSPELEYDPDSLFFTPSTLWEDGDSIQVCLDGVINIYAAAAPRICSWFRVDLTTPYVTGVVPDDYAVIVDPRPTLEFDIFDDLSGVDESSITIDLAGVITLTLDSSGVTFDPVTGHVEIDLREMGISLPTFDTLEICIDADDSPDYCAPNHLHYCWHIFIEGYGPEPEIVEPLPNTYTACNDQQIILTVEDPDGIDPSSITLMVDDLVYDISDTELQFHVGTEGVDTIIYSPRYPWTDGQVVHVELLTCADSYGYGLGSTISYDFYVDLTPPVVVDMEIAEDEVVSDPFVPITIWLFDSLSGIDPSSVVITVEGVEYSGDSLELSWGMSGGDSILIVTVADHDSFTHNQIINVCVYSFDTPDYCDPNEMEFCYEFRIDLLGPVGFEPVSPDGDDIHMATSSCADQGFCFEIVDVALSHGVDPTTIVIDVDGTEYSYLSPEISWDAAENTVCFDPESIFVDHDTVLVSLVHAFDTVGNDISDTFTFSYIIDLEPPFIPAGAWPAHGAYVGMLEPVVTFSLDDEMSVVASDSTRICVRINSTGTETCFTSTDAGVSVTGDDWEVDFGDLGISITGGDSVFFCVYSADDPDLVGEPPTACPPNFGDTCWIFSIPTGAPIPTLLVPFDGAYSACDDQGILIELFDIDGIDPETIELEVDGTIYTPDDSELELITHGTGTDTIRYTPASIYSDGHEVNVRLLSASDILGNELEDAPIEWSFTIDLSEPNIIGIDPAPESWYTALCPTIEFDLEDIYAGIDTATIRFYLEGIAGTTHSTGVTWTETSVPLPMGGVPSGHLEIDVCEFGLELDREDTVEFCIHVEDHPDYCDANILDSCWIFYVIATGPNVEFVSPFDGAFSACDPQEILLTITDDEGVNESTILFDVNGTDYTTADPELTLDGDTLRFVAAPGFFADGEEITATLEYVEDLDGNAISGPVSITFWLDYSPPVVLEMIPDETSDIITDADLPLIIHAMDTISGISEDSLVISLNGTIYRWGDLDLSWDTSSGDSVLVIEIPHASFTHNETVEVCIHVTDSPDFCPPNYTDTCRTFLVDILGPVASGTGAGGLVTTPGGEILEDMYTSCDNQGFCFELVDSDIPHGVDEESIVLSVGGVDYSTLAPQLTYDGSMLCFTPGAIFVDGQLVEVELVSADDSLGNPLSIPFEFSFIVDLVEPNITAIYPAPGMIVGSLYPTVTFTLDDIGTGTEPGAGVDVTGTSGIDMEICITASSSGTTCYTLADAGFSFVGGDYSADFAALGISIEGGDEVEFCLTAPDLAGICGSNVLDTCWTFYIPAEGPIGIILEPLNGTYSACDDQGIHMSLYDTTGIVESTISLEVNGTVYTTADPELTMHYLTPPPDSLVWLPSVPFTDGEVVNVSLLTAEDSLGNELFRAPISWSFTIDLTPPIISNIVPEADSMLSIICPNLEFDVVDLLSGLNEDSLWVTIDGSIIRPRDFGVTFDGSHFAINLCDAEMELRGGDTVHICIHAEDTPDYCAANEIDTCWNVYIEPGGPVAWDPDSLDGLYSACDPQIARIVIEDDDGIDESSIVLEVNGVMYTIGSTEVTLIGDTLVFDPGLGAYSDGDVITVTLHAVEDLLHNPLTAPITFSFTVDLAPPLISGLTPAVDEILHTLCPVLVFDIEDLGSGLDETSLGITVDGSYSADISTTGASWDGTTYTLDLCSLGGSWVGGDLIEVCIGALDMPDLCPPNVLDTCYTFSIDGEGPTGEVLIPLDGTFSACDSQGIRVLLTDPDGIDESSIEFRVGSTIFTTTDADLYMSGDTLIWTGHFGYFSDGEVVNCEIVSAYDLLHNPIDPTLAWSFTIDYSSPSFSNEIPPLRVEVTDITPEISIDVTDLLSGVDPDSFVITIDGITYTMDSTGLSWDGVTLTFSSEINGRSWRGGDSVHVFVTAYDSPDYCESNIGTFDWYFFIPAGGPIPEIIEPLDSTISACDDQRIILRLFDAEGVDESTIMLNVNGNDYVLSNDELTFNVDTLIFTPPPGFINSGDMITVTLVSADDILGNPSPYTPLTWVWWLDLEGPEMTGITPMDGVDLVGQWQPIINSMITDDVLGVDSTNINITISGLYRTSVPLLFSSPDVTYSSAVDSLWLNLASVDHGDYGITYSTCEDTMTGVYMPEFANIEINITASDNVPDYCDPNVSDTTINVYIADDDTIAPVVVLDSPTYINANALFNINLRITDHSGVYDNSTQTCWEHDSWNYDSLGAYILWDTDGELVASSNRLELDYNDTYGITINPDGTITMIFTSTEQVGPFPGESLLVYEAYINDGDYDFMNQLDHQQTIFMDSIPLLYGPTVMNITPLDSQITSCLDQQIIILLYDPEGIDESTISLHVEDEVYDVNHDWLEWFPDDSVLIFTPSEEIFENNQEVNVLLEPVFDLLGNPSDTLEFVFYVDNEPPVITIVNPHDGDIIPDEWEHVIVEITDNMAGIRIDSLVFDINDSLFRYIVTPGLTWDSDDNNMTGELEFIPEIAGFEFTRGDTGYVTAYACDNPDIDDCGANCSEISWWFTLESVTCSRQPNPFTPGNHDGYNDYVVFSYPDMFAKDAELKIFTKRKELVYEAKIPRIEDYSDYTSRLWDGIDNNGRKMPSGLYIYLITQNDKVVCSGTVTLVR